MLLRGERGEMVKGREYKIRKAVKDIGDYLPMFYLPKYMKIWSKTKASKGESGGEWQRVDRVRCEI
jgi:hypothetical protein